MFLQGNLAGELFSGTLLSRTEPESVPSSMGKKSSDRRRLAIKPKFVDRFCYHFDQFALTFSNNILWRKNQKAEKDARPFPGQISHSSSAQNVQEQYFERKCQKKRQKKSFLIPFHKTQVLPRSFLLKKIFILHEFYESFGERLPKKFQRGFWLHRAVGKYHVKKSEQWAKGFPSI